MRGYETVEDISRYLYPKLYSKISKMLKGEVKVRTIEDILEFLGNPREILRDDIGRPHGYIILGIDKERRLWPLNTYNFVAFKKDGSGISPWGGGWAALDPFGYEERELPTKETTWEIAEQIIFIYTEEEYKETIDKFRTLIRKVLERSIELPNAKRFIYWNLDEKGNEILRIDYNLKDLKVYIRDNKGERIIDLKKEITDTLYDIINILERKIPKKYEKYLKKVLKKAKKEGYGIEEGKLLDIYNLVTSKDISNIPEWIIRNPKEFDKYVSILKETFKIKESTESLFWTYLKPLKF